MFKDRPISNVVLSKNTIYTHSVHLAESMIIQLKQTCHIVGNTSLPMPDQ